jgi:hypothetical protein
VEWEFDVDVSTHELLRRGVLVADRRRVTVSSDGYGDASLAAVQLASVDGATPTDLWWRY